MILKKRTHEIEVIPDDRFGIRREPQSYGQGYPYDGRGNWYGEPRAYDRGSGGREPGRTLLVLPHDVTHSAWDDVVEAIGTPYFFKKAYNSQMGNATGIPGAGGNWSSDPSKPWDENEETFEESFDKVPVEPVPNSDPENRHDQTDDEVERKIDKIFHRGDNHNFVPEDVQIVLNIPDSVWPLLAHMMKKS